MDTLNELFEDELKDIYNAENQLLKALPKMAKKATSPNLREAFTSHLRETEGHVQRLEKIGKALDVSLKGKTCQAMKGLIKEGGEAISEKGETAVIDAALIAAAQRVEHYEMAAYGCVRTLAQQMGHSDAADLLQKTLNEEGAADKKLTEISQNEILPMAMETADPTNGGSQRQVF